MSIFRDRIVRIGELNLKETVAYFSVIPGFVIPIEASKYIKLLIHTHGYERYIITEGYERYIITEGIISIEFQSYVMFSHHPRDGLISNMPNGRINEEILVRTTRDMEDYTFQRITTAQMLDSNNLAMCWK